VLEGGRLGVPTAAGGASPGASNSVNAGATPQPVADEKEEGEEDDVDLVDAPPLQKEQESHEKQEGEKMDTT